MKQAATLFIGLCLISSNVYSAANPKLPIAQNLEESETTQKAPLLPADMPQEVMLKILSAEMALNRGQPEIALENYIDVSEETQDPIVAERATQIALSISGLEDAYIPAKIWADKSPDNLEAQITFAAILIRQGKSTEAGQYLLQVTKLDNLDADRHFVMLFKQLPEEKEKAHVIEALESVKDKTKSNLIYVALADISLFENKVEQGIELAQKALKLNPKDPKASILYAQGLFQHQQVDEGIAFIEKQLKRMPESLHLRQYYTQFLIDQNQLDKAFIQMQKLTTLNGIESKQKLQLARLSMQAGWLDIAETFLHQVRQDAEFKDTANYFLARLYESKNEADKSAIWYEKVRQGPFHVIAYIRASTLLSELKKYPEALGVLDRAEPQNYSDLKRLLLARVDVMISANDHVSAFGLLTEALQTDPDDIDYLYSRAIVAEKINKISIVEMDLKAILEHDPSHIDALNALGYILADKTDRYDEAQQLIETALKLSPNNPSILDSLGWLEYKRGNASKAITILRQALSLYPDPEIAAHLGEVLWSTNQHEEATKVWNDALETSPDDEKVKQTMERLVNDER